MATGTPTGDLAALAIEWSTNGREAVDQAGVFAQFDGVLAQAEVDNAGDVEVDQGDCEAALVTASKRLEAEYRVPYLAHAAMEPMNCTAWIHDDVCEIWTGTQNPLGARAAAAEAIGFERDNVIVHNAYLGGAFGRRSVHDYVVQAVRVAKVTNAPAKLIWSREEDIAQDRYRPAITSRFRGGLDGDGRPIVWTNLYVDKHEPAEAPRIPYAIDNQRIASMPSPTHVPFGVWRAVDHSQHAFFTESFIDELADPSRGRPVPIPSESTRSQAPAPPRFSMRRRMRPDGTTRWNRVAVGASRSTSPSAASLRRSWKPGSTRGRCAWNAWSAPSIAGYAVNPDGLAAQMESGIVYGLSAALYGEISLEKGRVKQSNFHDYPMLRIDEMPEVETVIVESGGPLGGAGEPGTPPLAPALANAIHDAIGVRIRELPISKHDLRVG